MNGMCKVCQGGVLSITRVGNSGVEEGRGGNSGEEKES